MQCFRHTERSRYFERYCNLLHALNRRQHYPLLYQIYYLTCNICKKMENQSNSQQSMDDLSSKISSMNLNQPVDENNGE